MIPAMTHPLGRYWQQPSRDSIEIDATHALMSEQTFKALAEYSSTFPSGVYEGKMWRRHDGAHDPNCQPARRRWLLCWYTILDESRCKIEMREVLLV
jgi:hypothetical protein